MESFGNRTFLYSEDLGLTNLPLCHASSIPEGSKELGKEPLFPTVSPVQKVTQFKLAD